MIVECDIEYAKKLINQPKMVITKGSAIRYEPFEKRVQLWNEIKENQETYDNGACGKILEDLDQFYRATFDYALLILSKVFQEKGDIFDASQIFSNDELEIYDRIEKYNVFEISSKQDIKKKVIARDKNLLDLFEDYYGDMDKWVEQSIGNSKIRLTLRYYLKKKWGEYKQKINDAINDLIREFDWFGVLVNEWRKTKTVITQETEIKLQDEKEPIEDGPRLMELGEAKFYENNFIGRIKAKLQRPLKITGKKVKVENLREYTDVNISKYLSKVGEKELKNIPENKYILAELTKKKFFRKESFLLKAQFCCRAEKYAKYGLDTYPLDWVDINPIISNAMEDTRNKRMLLCLASPTGFTKEVEDHVGGKEYQQNFLADVSLCLVDLVTGKRLFNPHDKTAKEFRELFILEIDEEKVAKAKTRITEIMLEKGGAHLDDFIKRYGDTKPIVEKAFYDLYEEKGYLLEYRKEFKTLILMRE